MASIAVQILQRMQDRLRLNAVTIDGETFGPPADLTVQRERLGKITPRQVMEGPLIILHMGGQKPTERDHHKSKMLTRTLEVLVTIAADANETKNSEAVDPATNWLVQALQSDPTLGGIAHWISEEGQEDFYTSFEEAGEVVALREMMLEVAFHTRTENPERRS